EKWRLKLLYTDHPQNKGVWWAEDWNTVVTASTGDYGNIPESEQKCFYATTTI
ncbi:jg23404, partial [Pararge aegeria aegeria]